MLLTRQILAGMMECGRLEPYSNKDEILELCQSAIELGLGVAYANLGYLPLVAKAIAGSQTRLGIPIAFPFGATSQAMKVLEARQALAEGAVEFDMVMDIQRFKSGEYDYVRDDIQGSRGGRGQFDDQSDHRDLLSDQAGDRQGGADRKSRLAPNTSRPPPAMALTAPVWSTSS